MRCKDLSLILMSVLQQHVKLYNLVNCWLAEHEPRMFRSLVFQQVAADLHKQQMGKCLAWYTEQCTSCSPDSPLSPTRWGQPTPFSSQEEWYMNAIQQSR